MYRVAEDSSGLADIVAAIKSYRLVALLSWQDMRQRYRRSTLGPFWLTVSTAIMIGSIALVFGQIFSSGMADFLPSLTIGLILWTFISSSITEGCAGFISAERIIKQLPIPLFVHVQRVVFRNMLILAHNAIIIVLVLAFLRVSLSWTTLLSLPGFLLLSINLLWIALFMAIVCTRYRDLPQIVVNFLQVAFFLTPIIWTAAILPARSQGFPRFQSVLPLDRNCEGATVRSIALLVELDWSVGHGSRGLRRGPHIIRALSTAYSVLALGLDHGPNNIARRHR